MTSKRILILTAMLACLAGPGVSGADEARPTADEPCLSQCDIKSDRCMADSNGDEKKQQACDDQYTKCLAQCR